MAYWMLSDRIMMFPIQMKASEKAIWLIEDFESCQLAPYRCPSGVWTIGYGHTEGVTATSPMITRDEAVALLDKDIARFERAVNEAVHVPLNQNQFDALVSLCFNIGVGAFRTSTLVRKLNDGEDAAPEFDRWNQSKGEVLPGLVRRRDAERKLFESPLTS